MICRSAMTVFVAFSACGLLSVSARAQDVPGIEICTVDKTMERRTSCLQSNVIFLQKTVEDLQATQKKEAVSAPVKDAPPLVKDGAK